VCDEGWSMASIIVEGSDGQFPIGSARRAPADGGGSSGSRTLKPPNLPD
jgi:hypothetical protein